MRLRHWMFGLLVLLLAAGAGLYWAWYQGYFDRSVHDASAETVATSQEVAGDLNEALTLARAAQAKLRTWPGYRCIYLRDEVIGNELQQNSLRLIVRHQPFSVNMEWVEPTSKKGRKAVYVEGKNNNKMIVKQLVLKLTLDPQESIKRKESRHTILEAGLKNMMDRFVAAWEEEQKANETDVKYFDAAVEVTVAGKHYHYPCRCVETTHPLSTKGKYVFARVKVYFSQETGLPVSMEGYDWPDGIDTQGRLLERYIYADMKTDPAPGDADFEL
jgi:hypothetical protein